jgi:peroxiredoxin
MLDEETPLEEQLINPESDNQPARRISPALILLLMSALTGVTIAVVALLITEPASPMSTSQANLPQGDGSTRVLRDWVAEDFELPALAGDDISLSDFNGRPVFLNFWRTDCPPCVRELPAFQQFIEEQGESGAVVLAVNQGEDADDIAAFLDDLGVAGIPVLLDRNLSLRRTYPVNAMPTTYFIDSDGVVQHTKIGEMTVEEMYAYIDAAGDLPAPRG